LTTSLSGVQDGFHPEHQTASWTKEQCTKCRIKQADRPDHEQEHDYHHDTKVKPEAATAVIELLMMGGKTPETCWAVNKLQDNKLKNCCIRLVIYLNCTIMHGLIQEPKKVALWNKRHFEEKNGECAPCLKYSVLTVVEKIYKMQHLEGSGTPVLYIGRTVLKW
jgi:hypothetical protein